MKIFVNMKFPCIIISAFILTHPLYITCQQEPDFCSPRYRITNIFQFGRDIYAARDGQLWRFNKTISKFHDQQNQSHAFFGGQPYLALSLVSFIDFPECPIIYTDTIESYTCPQMKKADGLTFIMYRRKYHHELNREIVLQHTHRLPNGSYPAVNQTEYPWGFNQKFKYLKSDSIDSNYTFWPIQWQTDSMIPKPAVYWPERFEIIFIVYDSNDFDANGIISWNSVIHYRSNYEWWKNMKSSPLNLVQKGKKLMGLFYLNQVIYGVEQYENFLYRLDIDDTTGVRSFTFMELTAQQFLGCTFTTSVITSTGNPLTEESTMKTESTIKEIPTQSESMTNNIEVTSGSDITEVDDDITTSDSQDDKPDEVPAMMLIIFITVLAAALLIICLIGVVAYKNDMFKKTNESSIESLSSSYSDNIRKQASDISIITVNSDSGLPLKPN